MRRCTRATTWASPPGSRSGRGVVASHPLRLAHRGDWRRAPENSLAAFAAALAVPACDGLELDVRASADGVPVICHDDTLARVRGRPDRIEALTAAALDEVGVPTLAAVLAAAGPRPFLDVEFKVYPGEAAIEVLGAWRGPALGRAVVSSFDAPALERVGRLRPTWPRWLNSHTLDDATVATAHAVGCQGVAVDWRVLDRRTVGLAHAAGLEVVAYTVRRRSTFDRLARLGLVAVCVEAAALDG
jgi:glycerophosphoryl diester phosphodiesterase